MFEATDVGRNVKWMSQRQDRIADKLPRTMPRYSTAAVDADYLAAIGWQVAELRAASRGEYPSVLDEQNHRRS